MTPAEFEIVSRPWGDYWRHSNNACFIGFYESRQEVGKPAFAAYRAMKAKAGRDPWTVDNAKVGWFKTLDDAAAALEPYR